jgi:hypothetical protein
LEKRIDELQNRFNQDSQKLNNPPSSDGPYKRPRTKSKKKKRRRGGQNGHKGHQQTQLKPTQVFNLKHFTSFVF